MKLIAKNVRSLKASGNRKRCFMSGVRLHKEHGLNPTIPVCFLCGKDKNELVLLGAAYKEKAPMHMCMDKEPCDDCKEKMKEYVVLVEVKDGCDQRDPYRTGMIAYLKHEAAKNIFGPDVLKHKAAFVEQTALKQILGDLYPTD